MARSSLNSNEGLSKTLSNYGVGPDNITRDNLDELMVRVTRNSNWEKDLKQHGIETPSQLRTSLEDLQNSAKKGFFRRSLDAVTGTVWGGVKGVGRIVAAPFKFAWNNPGKTALIAALALIAGPPLIAKLFGNVEGGLATIPMKRIIDAIRSIAPLSGTNTAPPVPEVVPPFMA